MRRKGNAITHKKHPNFTVGEEDCDGLCPDIRVRGDLGNHQFRSIINIMTKMSIKLMKMTMMLILNIFDDDDGNMLLGAK